MPCAPASWPWSRPPRSEFILGRRTKSTHVTPQAAEPGRTPVQIHAPAVATTGGLIGGESLKAAPRGAGIGQSTLYRWRAKARAEDPGSGALAEVMRRPAASSTGRSIIPRCRTNHFSR
jgi:hypothetical protein